MTAEVAAKSIGAAVRRYVAEYPEMASEEAAAAIVAGLSRDVVVYAAARWIALLCDVEDRAVTRRVEKKASKPAAPAGYEYDDNGDLVSVHVRRRRENRQREDEWARAFRVADGTEAPRNPADLLDCQEFADNWRRRERLAEEAAQREKERHQAFIDRIKAEARLEWTTELLASTFAVGDGTRVSWADATVQQHEQRIDFLVRHVEGNLDTVKRHEAAVTEILAAHADTLAGAIADAPGAIRAVAA